MNNKTKKMCLSAMLAALTCVATLVVSIQIPATGGYINMGDCMVLISGWLLGPVYGFASAAIGSSLADIILGYVAYAPATFVIKGLMAVAAYLVYKIISGGKNSIFARIASAVAAEFVMVFGYYLFESVMYYGFVGASAGIPSNLLQALGGIVAGTALCTLITANIKGKVFR